MKEQLLKLLYEKQDEVFLNSERDEFDCLVYLIEDGTISTFEDLAEYGVECNCDNGQHPYGVLFVNLNENNFESV
jgi:hypothetical protein